MPKKPNILHFGIDSLRADHMSCYGYRRLTTPHIDRFAGEGVLFERTYSPHIPTTSGYGSMLTGTDCFTNQVVALRHKGPMRPEVKTMAEVLRDAGYNTSCVGFTGNPASRGFDTYLDYPAWGSWDEGRSPKAQRLNDVAVPELERLIDADEPFYVLLRHMDPHAPYLPPQPYERIFYHGDETDPANTSMEPVLSFKPFRDFLASWMPPGITDKEYVIAQYDGAVAYMDAAIQTLLTLLEARGVLEDTIVVMNSDHGETLYDHECFFDHHGIYDVTLHVPLIIRYPSRLPQGARVAGYNQQKDLMPTLLELADIDPGDEVQGQFDGRSLLPMVRGEVASHEGSFYITECTWMRKHGWRTPEWKLIRALEPDFHGKPLVELYNLVVDPDENHNLAEERPEVVAFLTAEMEAYIARREAETGLPNPILQQPGWHGKAGIDYFESSEQAYETLYIGTASQAARLQARDAKTAKEAGEKE
jgi:arylsulfatase A-like enzyme